MKEINYINDDEINLKELFQLIWNNKKIILSFVFLTTMISIIYVFYKTPIYEVKSIVQVAHINNKVIENSEMTIKKLNVIFNVDRPNNIIKENARVSAISNIRGSKNLIEISTQGTSNSFAIKKNEEVLSYLKKTFSTRLNSFKLETNLKIDELEREVKNMEVTQKNSIIQQIKYFKEIELPSIEKKLLYNKLKLEKYEKDILKKKDNIEATFHVIELLSNQSLIFNLKNKIEELTSLKNKILYSTIKDLEVEKNINLNNKIKMIRNKITIQKNLLSDYNISNFKLVGNMIVNDNPIKPKKRLIIIGTFLISSIISILLIFFLSFINFKEEKNDK